MCSCICHLCFITNRMRGIWNTKGAPQDNLLFCHSCDCDHPHFPSTPTSTETSKVLVKIRLINFLEGSQTTREYWLTLTLFNGNLLVSGITCYHANTDKSRMWNIFWMISERFGPFDSIASFDIWFQVDQENGLLNCEVLVIPLRHTNAIHLLHVSWN